MRIAHVSDTHLGYMQYHLRERKEDFFRAFEKVVDRVIEEGVELLVHSGDLFESYHPDVETLSFAISQFKRLKDSGISIVAVTGNHDRALRKGNEPPHKILSQLGLVNLLDPFGELEVKGVYFAGFRYFPKRLLELFRERHFFDLQEKAGSSGLSVLILHQAVDPFISYRAYHPEAYELTSADLPKGFTYYAAGHIHAFRVERFEGGLFSYAGSTEFRNSSEAEIGRRGFNLVDLESGEFERVELEGLRPFLVLKTDSQKAYDDFRELLERVKSSPVPPVVSVTFTETGEVLEKFSSLLKEIEERVLYLRVLKRSREKEESGGITPPGTVKYPELIELFCRENNFPEKVTSLAVELVNHGADDVEQVVREYLKREMGELFSLVERFGV